MFRKLALVAFAAASLGAAALAPTSASAFGGHHGGGHGWHGGGHGGHGGWHGGGWHGGYGGWHRGPRFVGGPAYFGGGCFTRRLVPTPWGPRWRTVNRCY
jgi:Spy/CpxP family protein refolding chaperone